MTFDDIVARSCAAQRKQAERITLLASHGVLSEPGKYAGSLDLSAGAVDTVLRMLRKLKRLEELK